eukprot:6615443-Pyramimonas_sp.AAC.1
MYGALNGNPKRTLLKLGPNTHDRVVFIIRDHVAFSSLDCRHFSRRPHLAEWYNPVSMEQPSVAAQTKGRCLFHLRGRAPDMFNEMFK